MEIPWLTKKAQEHLEMLCNTVPNRRVGSKGNQLATTYFAETMKSLGFLVECPEFQCMDWQSDNAIISTNSELYDAKVSPYSLGTHTQGTLVSACTVTDLGSRDISNRILLMRGELTREQFMPKNFPFFQAQDQQKIIRLLERKPPKAIITATTRNPEMAGALYPFPVFEDGDFDIPSVFITDEQGNELARQEGKEVTVDIRAERIPTHACNVVARKGKNAEKRIVLFAHIDAKVGTPGALDNGTGIVTLLLLGELLQGYTGNKYIEIVALNGEDYYSNPGEQLYLQRNEGKFHNIILGVNLDGLGYLKGKTAFSLYDCPPERKNAIENTFSDEGIFVAGEPWFQGDHMLFLMNQRPALALTSEWVDTLMRDYIHTDRDTTEIIDPEKVASTALALHQLLTRL